MAQTYLPTPSVNALAEVLFPASTISLTATVTNGTTTLTYTPSEAALIQPGMTVASGAGISVAPSVQSVNLTTGVATLAGGTITTLTASKYVFQFGAVAGTFQGSLHTGSPSTTGANEVSGGTYTRQPITFGVAVAGVKTSTNAQNWTLMPSCTVPDFGFNANTGSSGGTYLGGGVLGATLTVPAGATVSAVIGAITITAGG